jgi:hypothetical protein
MAGRIVQIVSSSLASRSFREVNFAVVSLSRLYLTKEVTRITTSIA